MSSAHLECVEIEPRQKATSSVIWLHGLGADGHDFEPIVPSLGLPEDHAIRFVFPHAPRIPVTLNQGMVMRAWYDIVELDLKRGHDEEGIRGSARRLEELIVRENQRGVPCERILLAGFSQGGAISLFTGLRYPERLAGILALSTYMLLESKLEQERSSINADIPIFQAHGIFDPMVPFDKGTAARDGLQQLGYSVEWHEYPMQHQVVLEEIQAIGAWLQSVLH
ncbi:MAG TPA: carboxylesterase [Candidatus Krumholzibacteria bacterium]|nr:carboxylesterase [Candidatus Krumholzibacteria bacterium]